MGSVWLAVKEVNGNDVGALLDAFNALPFEPGKPSVIIAHTTKGKGVSYMENELKMAPWRALNAEYETANA
jgi:transketolase